MLAYIASTRIEPYPNLGTTIAPIFVLCAVANLNGVGIGGVERARHARIDEPANKFWAFACGHGRVRICAQYQQTANEQT